MTARGALRGGAAFADFAIVRALWPTLTLLAVAGAVDTFTVVFRQSILQAVTPEPLRGRVLAADYVVGTGGPPLGNLEGGALASVPGTPSAADCRPAPVPQPPTLSRVP